MIECFCINGALAQLGERFAGSEEVIGSSPICSIERNLCLSRVLFLTNLLIFSLRNIPFELYLKYGKNI